MPFLHKIKVFQMEVVENQSERQNDSLLELIYGVV